MTFPAIRIFPCFALSFFLAGCVASQVALAPEGEEQKNPVIHIAPKVATPLPESVTAAAEKTASEPNSRSEPEAERDSKEEEEIPDEERAVPAGLSEKREEKAIRPVEKKAEPPEEETPPERYDTTLQEVAGPRADDELLDLWKKDVGKAMEKPSGQRKIRFSLPIVKNQRVRHFIDFFSNSKQKFFRRALARSGRYVPMMAAILREEGLPEDLVYLSLIESGFSPHAYSRAKAVGPWQFIRSTARRYGLKINSWVDERKDPVISTRAAAAYLKDLHEQFGEWYLAAAAYNGGEGRIGRAVTRSKTNDFWRLSKKHMLIKEETRNYVPKFIAAAIIASAPEEYGFGDVVYEPPLQYSEVVIRALIRLETVAELAGTSVGALRELNPALLRNFTPPDREGYILRLPPGQGETFARAYDDLGTAPEVRLILHKVKKGETLSEIARRYRQTVKGLMEDNGLKSWLIRIGQQLIVAVDVAAGSKTAVSPPKATSHE
jgi:hypothetical protein